MYIPKSIPIEHKIIRWSPAQTLTGPERKLFTEFFLANATSVSGAWGRPGGGCDAGNGRSRACADGKHLELIIVEDGWSGGYVWWSRMVDSYWLINVDYG